MACAKCQMDVLNLGNGMMAATAVLGTPQGPLGLWLEEPVEVATHHGGSVKDVYGDIQANWIVSVGAAPTPLVDWWDQAKLDRASNLLPDFMLGCFDVRAADYDVLVHEPKAVDRRKRQAYACHRFGNPSLYSGLGERLVAALGATAWGTDTSYGFIVVPDAMPDALMEPFMHRRADWNVLAGDEVPPVKAGSAALSALVPYYGQLVGRGLEVYDTTRWQNRNNRMTLERWYQRDAAETERWRRADQSGSLGLGGKGQQVAKNVALPPPGPGADPCEGKSLGQCLALRAAEILKAVVTDPLAWLALAASIAWMKYVPLGFGAWIPVVTYAVVKSYWGLLKYAEQGK